MANTYDFGALRFVFRGAYVSTTAYTFNDVVKYNGALYVFTSRTNATGATPADASPWGLMLQSGLPFTTGTRAARPAAGTLGAAYLVSGDTTATNNGILFFDTGSTWVTAGSNSRLVRLYSDASTDIPFQVTGGNPQSADLARFTDFNSNVLTRITSRGAILPPVVPQTTFGLDTAANGYRPLTITTATAGGTTLTTATLTYDASTGNLLQIVTVGDGRTVTRILSYDANNNLTSATETITAGV